MNEKFKIIDTGSPYGVRYPYTPMHSNGKDARVEIYPPSRLAEGIAFAKEHDIRAVRIAGNPSTAFSLDFSAFESFPEMEVLEIWENFEIGEVKGAEALYGTSLRALRFFENAEFELDFSRFKNLEALEAAQNKRMKFNHLPPTLRRTKISKLSHENLGIFRDTPKLERLELNFSKVTSLEGIKGCGELEHLSVFSAPRLTNISELNGLKKLKQLSFERCKLLTGAAMQGVAAGGIGAFGRAL